MRIEALFETLKIFIEKRLVPTVLSVVIGIIAYLVTPENNKYLMKIGFILYIVLWAGIAFLVITFVQFLFLKTKKHINKCKETKRVEDSKERQQIQNLWKLIDSLPVNEREFVERLVENENTPIVEPVYESIYDINSIKNNKDYVNSMEINGGFATTYKLLKLNDDFYELLVHSKKEYGKICNFREKEE